MNQIFPKPTERVIWLALTLLGVPLSIYVRLQGLDTPLVDPHPWRSSQTLLTVLDFYNRGINLLDYRSPLMGELWFTVFEFPLFQAIVSECMHQLNWSAEVASRAVSMGFFGVETLLFTFFAFKYYGKRHALWFFSLFLILPFNIVFSRVCLIDHLAVVLSFSSILLLLQARDSERPTQFLIYLFIGGVLGALAAVVKVQVWYIPATGLGLSFIYRFFVERSRFLRWFTLNLSLVFQLFIGVLWLRWTHLLKHDSAVVLSDAGWYFGDFQSRFILANWAVVGDYVFRSLFWDTLSIPFIVGLIFVRGIKQRLNCCFAMLVLISTLVMWNVHLKHNYYFIAYAPYLVLVAVAGLVKLFESRIVLARVALCFMGLLLCYRVSTLGPTIEPLFTDFRPFIEDAIEINRNTDRRDVVYASGHHGDLHLPAYADRMVGTWDSTNLNRLLPSVFIFSAKRTPKRMAVLDKYPEYWIEGNRTKRLFYRVKKEGSHRYRPRFSIRMADWSRPTGVEAEKVRSFVNACDGPVDIELPEGDLWVALSSPTSEESILLPKKRYLTLPPNSPLGCRYRVMLVPVGGNNQLL